MSVLREPGPLEASSSHRRRSLFQLARAPAHTHSHMSMHSYSRAHTSGASCEARSRIVVCIQTHIRISHIQMRMCLPVWINTHSKRSPEKRNNINTTPDRTQSRDRSQYARNKVHRLHSVEWVPCFGVASSSNS